MNRVQNGIICLVVPSAPVTSNSRLVSAYISSRKARPLKMIPRPNLRGIDGLLLPSRTHSHAMIGAKAMIASEFTDWNHATGHAKPNTSLWTISLARKVNELPACSKNTQKRMLNAKMISMAIARSRATGPSLTPSTMIIRHSKANIGNRTYHCSEVAEIDSRK